MNSENFMLKPIKELFGMNFFIPDYQRGYRWEKQQAIDLLDDIASFSQKDHVSVIYCIQPLVVQQRKDEAAVLRKIKTATSMEEVKKYMQGSWNVVDGQQRLTTIYLILSKLNTDGCYSIEYQTREDSKVFLKGLKEEEIFGNTDKQGFVNIDYYHLYKVQEAINEWFGNKDDYYKKEFMKTLLDKVCFIWYQIDNKDNAISVFTRLNIGKIPLTDSELIKALFLNRSNFGSNDYGLEMKQQQIATEWDRIEYALQNDEFWLFLHEKSYSKPTRIDFILDMIASSDKLGLFDDKKSKRKTKKATINNENARLKNMIDSGEHNTFRYFYGCFNKKRLDNDECTNAKWVNQYWDVIKNHFQIFDEWYRDYKLYHYIGYLTTVSKDKDLINNLLTKWKKTTKKDFVNYLVSCISETLKQKKWISEWKTHIFEAEGNNGKRDCIDLLLLHNIETIVKQNEKLVSDNKYDLPNFTKFPFHLYKSENWQVEHIRPNAGDNFKDEETRKAYLLLAKNYLVDKDSLYNDIDKYVRESTDRKPFEDIIETINEQGSPLSGEDVNKIWNYTLLDESTNKEYGNAIFPIKRAFISQKESGFKAKYTIKDNKLAKSEGSQEIAFIPPCTKNVFSKFYTEFPDNMIAWTEKDANAYLHDIEDIIGSFFSEDER